MSTVLPLSFGPDALCLRAGARTIQVEWSKLAAHLGNGPDDLVTVHVDHGPAITSMHQLKQNPELERLKRRLMR